ncbi:MAG: ATP-dependent protease ATPase subunit HslU [Phycisphaerae bacterium]
MPELTPKQIVEILDRHIIGQDDAKRAVAVAIRNRWRRQQLPEHMRAEVGPKNIIMIGPTGVGKTEIARRMAGVINAPMVKVEATKYTEVGYVGRDVESIVRDLVDEAVHIVRQEQTEVVREEAQRRTEEALLDALLPATDVQSAPYDGPESSVEQEQAAERRRRSREKLRAKMQAGELEDAQVELTVEKRVTPVGMFATTVGMDQMGPDLQNFMEQLMPSQAKPQRRPVREARKIMFQQECDKLIDPNKVNELAIQRTENNGIIFIDEIDKVCGPGGMGPEVSRQGVQRDLLPIVEGCTVNTRCGPVKTDHVLCIAAGAFHATRPSDLMPELQGRFPIRVELADLTGEDFRRILTEPEGALIKQQIALMATEGVKLNFTDDAITGLAEMAYRTNQNCQNIGARRLHSAMEKLMETLSFDAPDHRGESIVIDRDLVEERLAGLDRDESRVQFGFRPPKPDS